MMNYHILNGDFLLETFNKSQIEGKTFVMRECLVVGDVMTETIEEFWQIRGRFIAQQYETTPDDYDEKVKAEFEKMQQILLDDELNLWFGYDLFCQVNVWFIIDFLAEKIKAENMYFVYPSYLTESQLWDDFGNATPEKLQKCYQNRIKFTEKEIQLARALWKAYQNSDLVALEKLSTVKSDCFPTLRVICMAEIERKANNRPQKVLEGIIQAGTQDFDEIFRKFTAQEGIYGFGDSQVKELIKTFTLQ